MPIEVEAFEKEVKWLINAVGDERYGYFDFNGEERFTEVASKHFEGVQGGKKYGVYILRSRKNKEVIYIGKGGTITQNGDFKGQDIRGRLTNTRRNKNANDTFLEYYRNDGPLRIEYLILPDKELCPSMFEAFLLQAYLKEHGHLPRENKEL